MDFSLDFSGGGYCTDLETLSRAENNKVLRDATVPVLKLCGMQLLNVRRSEPGN
ncbi:hypothetical protein BANRA_02636 [Escherichia coli]|uniref:Uncharacterized protein n=1 Tax=Escherichia coli TaxID=562 RepID=A0A3P5DSM4_ECOLX|nr:hypothetical protein BANRA_02636 [Escherichia coli]